MTLGLLKVHVEDSTAVAAALALAKQHFIDADLRDGQIEIFMSLALDIG